MFSWAMSRDDIKFSPVSGVEAPPPLRARDRYLSDDELRSAWATSFTLTHPYGTMLRMLMLTGQRRGEVTGLDWSELSRARAEWIMSADKTKNRHLHIVPLSKQAVALLDGMAGGTNWASRGLVFQSARATALSRFSKIKKSWNAKIAKRVDSAASGQGRLPWRLHDIRRAVATGMQALSVRTEIIESVLNHLSGLKSGIVGVYQCYDYRKEKRQALDAWARSIERLSKA